MRIAFAATNPCHLYPIAQAVAKLGEQALFYSGYPRWKLPEPGTLEVRTHASRTTVVYGLLKFAPERLRPPSRWLFRWQDRGFDHWVGRHLQAAEFVHGLPGQCLETFRAARALGQRRVLNHATGPVRQWVRIMAPEYARAGWKMEEACLYDEAYFAREAEEYALADFHCAASTVVRDQLLQEGIAPERIWLVPYGADPKIFQRDGSPSPAEFRVVFAGQAGLRKGLRTFLEALTLCGREDWQIHFYGAVLPEAHSDLAAYQGKPRLTFHGPVAQEELARAFRASSVLVLPSLEEGFGLVVPQALHCGVPCLVSDRVGARDLIRPRDNGSIFPVGDSHALADELAWWEQRPIRVDDSPEWSGPARILVEYSRRALQGEGRAEEASA